MFLLFTGIEVLQLDVTKEEEWDLVIEHIQQNSKQLWGLVNNAGMYDKFLSWTLGMSFLNPWLLKFFWIILPFPGWSTFGDFEWVQMDTYRRIVEINIFGLLQALKKSAPLVRKGKGRIVTGKGAFKNYVDMMR